MNATILASPFLHAFKTAVTGDPVWYSNRRFLLECGVGGFCIVGASGNVLDAGWPQSLPLAQTLARFIETGEDKLPDSFAACLTALREGDEIPDGEMEATADGYVLRVTSIVLEGFTVGHFAWVLATDSDYDAGRRLEEFAIRTLQLLCRHCKVEQDKTCLIQEQQAIVDHISDGLLVIERDGVVRYMNSTAGRLLNLVPEQSIGKRFADLLDFTPIIQPIFESGIGYVDRELIIDSPGRHLHLMDTAIPIKNARGEVVSIVNTFRGIQRVRKLADKLQGNHARYTFDSLIGKSDALRAAVDAARKAARGFANVLLNGESGVGKEVFAQAIHNASERADGPFIAINCAALPRDLIESELFGYTSGSFTGARKEGRPGKFESATGGTIFLDEISELPLDVQAKLLRVLQEREVVRIGDTRGIPVDVRIISACNRDLRDMIRERLFREDLFYRCNVIGITIPALRERTEDIPVLANHFLSKSAALLNKPTFRFSPTLIDRMCRHAWPGNVRELENCVERMVNLCEGDQITEDDFPEFQQRADAPSSMSGMLPMSLREAERAVVEAVLRDCRFNITEAARRLGISKPTLYSKIREHEIPMERGSLR
ncbi:MAG TPA: sigma 54-interacting transcriptional regulator [Noviherbaspirillum sp.]